MGLFSTLADVKYRYGGAHCINHRIACSWHRDLGAGAGGRRPALTRRIRAPLREFAPAQEGRIDRWELRQDEYQEIAVSPDRLLKSQTFPGLWLDAPALLRLDMKAVLAALQRGLDSPEHRTFLGA